MNLTQKIRACRHEILSQRVCKHAGQKAALFLTRKLLWIAVITTFCLAAHATSSLSFDGGGYELDLEIGDTDRPVVASVTFHRLGDAQGVVLRGNFWVQAFDPRRQELVLVYGGGDRRVEPFTLTVHGSRASLAVVGRRIRAPFCWAM